MRTYRIKQKLLHEHHLTVFQIVAEVYHPQVSLFLCFYLLFTEFHVLCIIMILKTWKIFLNVIAGVCNTTRS